MRILSVLSVCALLLCLAAAFPAQAELQNVEVGGELHVRGYWWHNTFNEQSAPGMVRPEVRWPAFWLPRRPIGDVLGGASAMSYYDWSDAGPDYRLAAQRTRLHVKADFTNEVNAFIEFDAYTIWGTGFRSNYLTGADMADGGASDVNLYQAYVEANGMWGTPLRLRVGRQELFFGKGWLVGANNQRPEFAGLSFDALRLTCATDVFSVDAFAAKLQENGVFEEDGDVDLYGVYGSYYGIEDVTLDAYWLWLRDGRRVNDTNLVWWREWIENVLGRDDYDVTNLHTLGLRGSAVLGGFDIEAEAAYQFGDAGGIGWSYTYDGVYGDDEAEFDAWAADLEVGYTVDTRWQPRFYLGAAYFGGEDNRDVNFWEWLTTPSQGEASISFNRLFSDRTYSYFLDEMGQMSNVWTVRGGLSARPTESIEAGLDLSYFQANETFDRPWAFRVGRLLVPIVPSLSFLTKETGSELGWETHLWLRYAYSEDLVFSAGWAHLFTGGGLTDGNYTDLNGLLFTGGRGGDDADFLYIDAKLSF